GPWLKNLGRFRREILASQPAGEERKALLHQLAERKFFESSLDALQSAQSTLSETPRDDGGKVFLVGAGPGDPDLLIVKALRLIQSADVILHDDLVPEAVLKLGHPGAEIANVGKRCGAKNITQEEI